MVLSTSLNQSLPVRDSDSPQTRTKTTVQSEHSLAFDNTLDNLKCSLFPAAGVSISGRHDGVTHLVLALGLHGSSG